MTRRDNIRASLTDLESRGVIRPGSYAYGTGNGLKWVFEPCGHAERSLTTSQVEDFILGARAAIYAADQR